MKHLAKHLARPIVALSRKILKSELEKSSHEIECMRYALIRAACYRLTAEGRAVSPELIGRVVYCWMNEGNQPDVNYRAAHVSNVEDMAKNLETGLMFVDDTGVAYLCPCGCGSAVKIELTQAMVYTEFEGKPSLSAPIRQLSHLCKSHYRIQAGKVYWFKDKPQAPPVAR